MRFRRIGHKGRVKEKGKERGGLGNRQRKRILEKIYDLRNRCWKGTRGNKKVAGKKVLEMEG